jgi:hypothetical protein
MNAFSAGELWDIVLGGVSESSGVTVLLVADGHSTQMDVGMREGARTNIKSMPNVTLFGRGCRICIIN